MDPTQFLLQKIPGYVDLHDDERAAISEFSLIWAVFEGLVCNTEANPPVLLKIPVTLQEIGRLDMVPYEASLSHFQSRYFADGELTHYFYGLRLDKGSPKNAELVRSVVSGEEKVPTEVLRALLLICHRLRNNLFHGVKMQYGIAGQRENFRHGCRILMAVVDQHPPAY